MRFSRRRFLATLAAAAGSVALDQVTKALPVSNPYPFEEVPSSSSRISWVHTAGKSDGKYLPETTGAGCAFLDYDNDGWMDITWSIAVNATFTTRDHRCATPFITTTGTEPSPTSPRKPGLQ